MYMDNKPLNRIKVVMAERMVSNKELDEMLGKDTATISRWVTNTSQPTLESLIEIAKALKCNIGDLVRMDDSTILRFSETKINFLSSSYANNQNALGSTIPTSAYRL